MMEKVIDNNDYNKEMEKDNIVALEDNWPLKGNSQMELVVKSTHSHYALNPRRN